MEREDFTLVELDVASTATKGPPGERLDEFGGQNMIGLGQD
jgi:hypothetical protein